MLLIGASATERGDARAAQRMPALAHTPRAILDRGYATQPSPSSAATEGNVPEVDFTAPCVATHSGASTGGTCCPQHVNWTINTETAGACDTQCNWNVTVEVWDFSGCDETQIEVYNGFSLGTKLPNGHWQLTLSDTLSCGLMDNSNMHHLKVKVNGSTVCEFIVTFTCKKCTP